MKTKYTPDILAHVAIYKFRRNNLDEALNRIDRAIKIKQEIQKDQDNEGEGYVTLYLKKAFILAKLRKFEETMECLKVAQKIRQRVF